MKRLAHGRRDFRLVADREDFLRHLLQQADLRQFVDLVRTVFVAAGHVADQADERDAVEQGLADAAERVGKPRTRHDRQDAWLPGAAGIAVGHGGCREFVRHQQVTQAARLHRVPELILLRPGDAEDALGALGKQGFHERFRAGHVAGDGSIRAAGSVETRGSRGQPRHQRRDAGHDHGLEKLAPGQGKVRDVAQSVTVRREAVSDYAGGAGSAQKIGRMLITSSVHPDYRCSRPSP